MLCPRCKNHMALDKESGKTRCPACGFRLFEDDLESLPRGNSESHGLTPGAETLAPGMILIDLTAGMDFSALLTLVENEYDQTRIRGRCLDAIQAIHDRSYPAARIALKSVLDMEDRFSDAWLFLAAIAENAVQQREYLEQAVACDPSNMRAVEYLMKLKGPTPQVAEKYERLAGMAASPHRLDKDEVAAAILICPQCGGHLDYQVGEKEVLCKFCGFHILDADQLARTKDPTPILEEILRRKHSPTQWNIGERWLRCPACGATATVSHNTLANTCHFCGSQQIVQEGVNSQFEQPDLIVPLGVSEADARASIDRKVHSGLRAITSIFTGQINIKNIDLHGAYLPFWVFDADMSVKWSWSNAPERGEDTELADNVLYFAGKSLPRVMLDEVEPFDLKQSVDYDPRLLAVFPALLYDIEPIQASIDVRTRLSQIAMSRARVSIEARRPAKSYERDSNVGQLNLFAAAKFITYRLALLPVWVGRLVEENGEARPVIVNGQTGEAVFGKSIKKDHSGQ